ncbi:MAG: molybdate ABC transporter substrate-binding protein [Ilumatobacteraceae bacterium]
MRGLPRYLTTAVALLGLFGAACSDDSGSSPSSTPDGAVSGDIVVFAASSLTEAFTELGEAFSQQHPDANVTFNFAGSGDLVTQITEGAPADVFISADDSNMTTLIDAGENATEPVVVARNTFEIIVEQGNPQGVAGVADLANPDLIVVLCADTVPCGKGALKILENAGVTVAPKSLEEKVKGVVTKVSIGEADAGIVFVTDVSAAGDTAQGVEIPADINVISNYPIVVTKASQNPAAAQAFLDFVASDAGQAILAKYGFLAP